MVPWLLEGRPTSGFFRKDVKIGVVAWGYKFLGSAHRFLGRCLNLSLMDVLQSFSFFVIEGGETVRPVMSVEHEA